jgi:hypothetical protein
MESDEYPFKPEDALKKALEKVNASGESNFIYGDMWLPSSRDKPHINYEGDEQDGRNEPTSEHFLESVESIAGRLDDHIRSLVSRQNEIERVIKELISLIEEFSDATDKAATVSKFVIESIASYRKQLELEKENGND